MALWYSDIHLIPKVGFEGRIFRYDLRFWSSELAEIPGSDGIVSATISDDGKFLAYINRHEIVVFNLLFHHVEYKFPISVSDGISSKRLVFSSDAQLLAYDDAQGLNIINLSSGAN